MACSCKALVASPASCDTSRRLFSSVTEVMWCKSFFVSRFALLYEVFHSNVGFAPRVGCLGLLTEVASFATDILLN